MKHPIIVQATKDIKAARRIWLPWRVLLPWAALSLAVIVICDHLGISNMSVPLIMFIGLFGLLVYLKWGLRRQPFFWCAIAVFAALHALLIWYIPWTSKWVPAAAVAAIATIDLCLMLWVFAAIEVLLRTRSASRN
ncbi:MAG: hypothetical protein A3J40_03840 [Erythrobacter sp. RIFCSPHIGHO2_12_FULL_63_10]|nr:MAG: hypothetical protein A3J40_03840 [Erythrobacter sp. RIFCSPHIGHO2_12_FULL_63_10]